MIVTIILAKADLYGNILFEWAEATFQFNPHNVY